MLAGAESARADRPNARSFYMRTLRVAEDQMVVRDGPYRWVSAGRRRRSPAVARLAKPSQNAIVASSIVAVMLGAYTRRIATEGALLVDHLGAAHRDDMHQTSRILPGIYCM